MPWVLLELCCTGEKRVFFYLGSFLNSPSSSPSSPPPPPSRFISKAGRIIHPLVHSPDACKQLRPSQVEARNSSSAAFPDTAAGKPGTQRSLFPRDGKDLKHHSDMGHGHPREQLYLLCHNAVPILKILQPCSHSLLYFSLLSQFHYSGSTNSFHSIYFSPSRYLLSFFVFCLSSLCKCLLLLVTCLYSRMKQMFC